MSEMPSRSTNARPPTRADVARYAGVSTAVVSYVVNDGPRRVAPETAARVRAAIDNLNIGRTPTPAHLKKGPPTRSGSSFRISQTHFSPSTHERWRLRQRRTATFSSSPTQTQTRITRAGSSVTSPTGMWTVSSSALPSHPRLSVR